MRIAATADLHFGAESAGSFAPHLEGLQERADVLLVAGDLTRRGQADEARALAHDLARAPVPVAAVLGNHDYHAGEPGAVRRELEAVGVRVLEGDSLVVATDGGTLGVAGVTGFGGGFAGTALAAFGEPELKAFVARTTRMADALARGLSGLATETRVALMHYSPISETLRGEPAEIEPFMGSHLLGEAVDRAGCDLVLHGHAHNGTEKGATRTGIPVRNVAQPVLRCPYAVYTCEPDRAADHGAGPAATAPPAEADGSLAHHPHAARPVHDDRHPVL